MRSHIGLPFLWRLATCATLAACVPDSTTSTGTGGTGAGGGTGTGGDCIDPGSCPNGGPGTGPGGANCGDQTVPLGSSQVSPNVLLVIDRSGSMSQIADGTTSKWDGLKTSLAAVLDQNAGKAQWGLSLFPSGTASKSCDAGRVDVPIALGDEAAIKAAVNAFTTQQVNMLGGNTPTSATMKAISSAGVMVDPAHANYVVLMTDGQPNCDNPAGVTPAITALYAQSPSVRTFVIGFGADVNTGAGANLNEWAVAGHTDRPGATKYYVANTVMDLQTAFQSIVSGVASCTYQLNAPPSDPGLVAPYFDATAVASDATNGFTYDSGSQTVTFHGASCDQLKSGAVKKVDFVYGCAAPTVL